MTIDELRLIVESIKYKPGFRIRLEGDEFMDKAVVKTIDPTSPPAVSYPYTIRVDAWVTDAYDQRKTTTVRHQKWLNSYEVANWDRERALRFLFGVICDVEYHEAGEFFEVDGGRPFDPHK